MSEPNNWNRTATWNNYSEWSAAYKFAEKSGFELTKLQTEDVHKFLKWPNCANFYEVGGGKSAVSSVVAMMRGNAQKLVLVPPILTTPWAAWLNKVSAGVLVYRGTPSQRHKMDVKGAHWLVMSHAIFRDDFPRLEREVSPTLEIIVDEAHSLKNSGSVLFKKVQRLAQ